MSNCVVCAPYDPIIHVDSLARAYVPYQKMCNLFTLEESLVNGTVFPELYKPYMKEGCRK